MKGILFLLIIMPVYLLAAVVNLDFAVGSYSWFGLSITPQVQFWRVQADLAFTLGLVVDGSGLKVAPIYEPFDNLKYLSLDLDDGGAKYVVPYNGWLTYSNVEYETHTLSLWGLNGSVGFVIQKNYALFFKVPYFSICVDSNSGYHMGVPVRFGDLQIEPFVSNYGYGVGLSLNEISGFFIPNMGLRISLVLNRLFFFGQYLGGKTNIGFGWFNKDEWILITSESLDVRKEIGKIHLTLYIEKERWYAGLSFPVFW